MGQFMLAAKGGSASAPQVGPFIPGGDNGTTVFPGLYEERETTFGYVAGDKFSLSILLLWSAGIYRGCTGMRTEKIDNSLILQTIAN